MQVALVPYEVTVDANVLTQVAAALQQQVSQHFAPLWNIDATVSAFTNYNSVPLNYTRLSLVPPTYIAVAGLHGLDNGQPYATVAMNGIWSLAASHELLELLADPTGSRTISGPSPRDGASVEILVEVCDPCQGDASAYEVDGVTVSDFATPAFYSGSPGPYSYRGNLIAPRTIATNGYIVWHDPISNDWWRHDGGTPQNTNLGAMPPTESFLRGYIDRLTRATRPPKRAAAMRIAPNAAAKAKAKRIAAHIKSMAPTKAK